MTNMKKEILKQVLLNAVQYNGKADVGAVVGKIIAENPKIKNEIKKIIPEIKKTVKEVNSWPLKKQKDELSKFKIKKKTKKKEKYELPKLQNAVKGKVITVFPPEPSKYPHLGHAKAAFINYMYAKKYKGKFILRFEDTNPEKCKKEYYQAIIDGLRWLGIKWNKIDYASNYIEKFYKATEKLIKKNKAYVCRCSQEKIKKYRRIKKSCECRSNSVNENINLWKKMISKKCKPGEMCVRLKISMSHKNAAMRDPTIMRIIDKKHPRLSKKYCVYPMYDFATSIMDGIEKITHRIRSKEFEMRTGIQKFIQKNLGIKSPVVKEIARFNLKGVPSSGRLIREMIINKKLRGWDDPRLTTLLALKRRGFLPEALRDFLIATGVSKTESILTWDMLETFNRKFIDKKANRYFVVIDPIKIKIKNAPKIKSIKENLHPEFPKRGKRIIYVDLNEIYISKDDFRKYKNKKVRLLGLFNIKLNKISEFCGNEIVKNMPKIQWVSKKNIKLKIIMPDKEIKAIGEPNIKKLKIDDVIQLIRIGFCRIDKKKPEIVLYFTHG